MSFVDMGKQLDDAAVHLLACCRHRTLRSYEAYCPFGDDAHVYKILRLHFDGLSIDIRNTFEPLVIGQDYAEEQFAVMSIDVADAQGIWCPKGKELSRVQLGFEVADTLTVADSVLLSKGSQQLIRLKLTQAVLFEDPHGQLLAIDRDIWSDEYMSIRQGSSIATTTRDFRGDFVAEPPFAYKFGRDIHRLSNPHANK